MNKIKCPTCQKSNFEEVLEEEFKITFFVCTNCGKPVAYRDNEVIEKLDFLINETMHAC